MKRFFAILRFLVILGFGGLLILTAQQYHSLTQQALPISSEGESLLIAPGSSLKQVGAKLEARGLLPSALSWEMWARLEDKAQRIQAGEYRLEPGLTARSLLDKLVAGDVVLHSLTIPEGFTFAEMRNLVAEHPALKQTLTELSVEDVMEKLDLARLHPEGRFLPETYHFPRGTTDLEFLRRANRSLEEQLATIWAERDEALPLKSPYEALILASIIEKETGVASERGQISGVFVRRLNKRMRLQTDPTVIYGMGDRYDGNIRRRDLREATPYNTYVIKGLPPTPICLPGVDAIRAAVHPAPGDALFFVSRNDGSHVFSASLVEHERNVDRYQRNRPPAAPASTTPAVEGVTQ